MLAYFMGGPWDGRKEEFHDEKETIVVRNPQPLEFYWSKRDRPVETLEELTVTYERHRIMDGDRVYNVFYPLGWPSGWIILCLLENYQEHRSKCKNPIDK